MGLELIEQLTALLAPNALPVDVEGMEQRLWIVRVAHQLSDDWRPAEVAVLLSNEAASVVAKARSLRRLPQRCDAHLPIVRISVIGARHLVMSVVTIKLKKDDAHEYLAAASAALVLLDREVPIEDIQGIPRHFWRMILGNRDS
jgi:hypothetical protein